MNIKVSMMVLTALVAASAVHAETLDFTYTGTIYFAQTASSDPTALQNFANATGETVTGSFTIDTVTDVVTNSVLGNAALGTFGVPAVAGVASVTPDLTEATYTQGTNAGVNGPRNTSIGVLLSALTTFSTSDPAALLLQSPLGQQADFTGAASPFPSTVSYYDGAADGTGITQIDAYLTGASVSAVPLPAAVWLFGSGLAGLAGLGRRRPTGRR